MTINLQYLENREASDEIMKNFSDIVGDRENLTVLEIFNNPRATFPLIHWCYDNSPLTPVDKRAYLSRVNITNSSNIILSDNISDGQNIYGSSCVINSTDIAYSNHITESQRVSDSQYVKKSNLIQHSSFITNCRLVATSINITDSNWVDTSKYVSKSTNIYGSSNIARSNGILFSEQVSDAQYCWRCSNLKHALFCFNTSGDYYLFNKPVEQSIFEDIWQQYMDYFNDQRPALIQLQVQDAFTQSLTIYMHPDVRNWVRALPNDLFIWMASLPNYDSLLASSLFLGDERIVYMKN